MKNKPEIVEFSLEKLKEVCKELGWIVSFNEQDEYVNGMIIGTENFVDMVLEGNEDFQEYVVMSPDEETNQMH